MEFSKGTLSTVRNVNRVNILEFIKQSEPISRAAIARHLKMSRSNVSEIVDGLVHEGLVAEVGAGTSTPLGGRKPVHLQFVAAAKYSLGVDIGATKTIAVVTDLRGNVVARTKFASHAEGVTPFEHIACEVREFLTQHDIDRAKIVGTGIGVPGITNYATGELIHAPGLHINEANARDFFSGRLPEPVFVDNDVNMGVVGERWKGNAIHYEDVVLITIGTGIGAGLILNGQVHRGANGFAGEIGYFQVDPLENSPQATLSKFGPLESLASGQGIERQVLALLPQYTESVLKKETISTQAVFLAAASGDPLAKRVIDNAVRVLSFSIANLVMLIDPSLILIGGGVSQAGEQFLDDIRVRVARLTPMPFKIEGAGLGEDAGAYGGAATALMATDNLRLF